MIAAVYIQAGCLARPASDVVSCLQGTFQPFGQPLKLFSGCLWDGAPPICGMEIDRHNGAHYNEPLKAKHSDTRQAGSLDLRRHMLHQWGVLTNKKNPIQAIMYTLPQNAFHC